MLNKNLIDKKTYNDRHIIKSPKYKMSDAHVHYCNFIGETEGLKKLIHYMDKHNIEKIVIFGLPVKKSWSEIEHFKPNYYLDDDTYCYYDSFTDIKLLNDYIQLTDIEKDRFIPLLCGFNPMDGNSINYIEYMFKQYPGVFSGIGEIFYRHDDLSFQTVGDPPRFNNVFTHKILEFCSKYELPLLIHNNISSSGNNTYPKFLPELEDLLSKYSRAKIILAHCGISRGIKIAGFIKIIERLLLEYTNLYLDYSWIVFDDVIMENETSIKEWVRITEMFSDRIMIGSDVLGDSFYNIGEVNYKYNDFLTLLSNNTRNNILLNNVNKIYKKVNIGLSNTLLPNLF